ncbi:Nucleoid-associated protein YgaU, contains BON and LysM domains [Jatrophihabitans endophyticus]|uniref:Nucleoid-associated protein YgaU, contains BON and LysM domains n=1 Tax=Jatrophihabitans endophyticus TaxID=1206085 RepID=A0A1M5PL94_9ACTN|nr:transglycosylase family protein [Jatrophihabitans endophyticus]SHH02544.1 Nucleoid-associated protein YgaU, contains BON and LysM domains [Jatrophihabitans endophyticus]
MKSRSTVPTAAPEAASSDAAGTGSTSSGVRRTAVAVAASVGAAAAITTLATPAEAASKFHVWDRVAHCESSNNWDINTGNGFYGGLQFTDNTWDAYGGEKYAGRADNASRMEQIQVARRVLKDQGPDAWPVCSGKAGLTRKNGHATSAKLPDNASTGASSSTHHKKSHTKAHKAKHRHHADHHAKSSSHKAKHAKHETYTVRSGDTLAKIARAKHVDGGWKALYKANKGKLHNPNRIHVGQVLHLPS